MAFGLSAGAVALIAAGTAAAGTAYASHEASKAQTNASSAAAGFQKDAYNSNQQNLSPYIGQGAAAGTKLSSLMGTGGDPNAQGFGSLTHNFTGQDYLNNQDPGYQFQLQQGQNALQNSQAADSGAMSGAAMKGLIGYNQGMASTGYQNAFNRFQTTQNNQYSRLSGLMGLGENAAAGAGNTGAALAGTIGNTITGSANASAAGTVGVANAVTGAINNGSGYYMLNQMMSPNYTGANTQQTTAANGSADPIGSLNSQLGWTPTGPN
jgi:hypothetical protein